MTRQQLIIITLCVQLAVVTFGFIVWPGIWEYRDINGKSYKINRLTGELKVFDPVAGFIKPTPTPFPKLISRLGSGLERIQTAGAMCDIQQKLAPAGFNRKQCVWQALTDLQKQNEENEKEVGAGRATYDYKPASSPSP